MYDESSTVHSPGEGCVHLSDDKNAPRPPAETKSFAPYKEIERLQRGSLFALRYSLFVVLSVRVMESEMGHLLVSWTARLAVAGYVYRLLVEARFRENARARAVARWSWTFGCGFLLLHLACAFGYVHGWSHQAAYEHTAAQTALMTGIETGSGLYFNYAMALLWLGDVAAWWRRGLQQHPRWPGLSWCLQAYFAFMMINATAVFGPPFWKWVTAAIIATWLWFLRVR